MCFKLEKGLVLIRLDVAPSIYLKLKSTQVKSSDRAPFSLLAVNDKNILRLP